jgi:polar amino acid transport system substrate-binding protein
MQRILALCFTFLSLCLSSTGWAQETASDNLKFSEEGVLYDQIQARGKIIVGVKADYPPWGMYNADGSKLIGLEIDLAKDLASRLGVEVELVPVSSQNRLQKVEDGSIDLVIATMGDTDARREQSGLVLPNYYSSGVALLSKDDIIFTDWNQLKGREICLTRGAYFNPVLIERYLITPVLYDGTRDTGLGLKSGQCIGWAYDNTSLEQTISNGSWEGYAFKLPTILSAPWALAVPKAERNAKFGAFTSAVAEDWLRTGFILDLQTKWGLPQSDFLIEQKEIYLRRSDDGSGFVCVRDDMGQYPAECQSHQIVNTKIAIDDKPTYVVYLENAFGLNFSPFFSDYVRASVIKGIWITVVLSVLSIVGSLFFSVIFIKIGAQKSRVLRAFSQILVAVFRSTPPLILMYIVFFGFGAVMYQRYGVSLSSVVAAVLVFSLYAGAGIGGVLMPSYNQLVRDSEQNGGAGPSPLSRVFEDNIDAVVANCVNIVKATGLASAIAVPELITTSNSIIADWGNSSTMMNLLLIGYFIYVLIVVALLRGFVNLVVKHA